MKLTFKKDVSLDISRNNPNILIESVGINHYSIAMGIVRAIEKNEDTRVLIYYPTESTEWNDIYNDFFHTVRNVNSDVAHQIHFDDLVRALIEIGTFRWANICNIPKNMVLIVPYAEEVLKDADMDMVKALVDNCSSVGVHVIFISSWGQEEIDFDLMTIENIFTTVGKPTLTTLQLKEITLGDDCEFEGREVFVDDGAPSYTKHLFIDITEE